MKSTGVVRRIDDLGRIVIPKEIRRNLKIRDGESLEIFIDSDMIILKKYSRLENMNNTSQNLIDKISELSGYEIMVTDREKVILGSGDHIKAFINKNLSSLLIKLIDERESYKQENITVLEISPNEVLEGYFYILPLISQADSLGLIGFYSTSKPDNSINVIAQMLSYLICEQVDIS